MSKEALNWVKELKVGNATGAAILLTLAESADSLGFCRLSRAQISAAADCCLRSVSSWLKKLEACGYLSREANYNGDGGRSASVIQLNLQSDSFNKVFSKTNLAPPRETDAPPPCKLACTPPLQAKKEKKEKEAKRKKIKKNNNIINIYNNTANFQKDKARLCVHGESDESRLASGQAGPVVQEAAGFWGSYSPAASVVRYGTLDYFPASSLRISASVGGEGSACDGRRARLKLLAGGTENPSADKEAALAPWFQQTRELIRHNSALLEQNQKLIEQNNALVQNYASVVEKYAALVERMGASSKPDGAQESVAASKTATVTTAKEEEGIKPASPWKKNTMQAQQQGSARAVKADPIKPIVDEAEIDPPKEKQDLTAYLAEVKTRQAQFVRRAQKMDILRSTRLKRSPYYFVGNNKLTEPEKKELSKQVAALAAFLQKRQTTEDLQKAVEILFSNRAVPKGYNKKAYYLALEEYCPAILYDMVRNLLKGKILLSNTTFLPNCADLSKHCRNKQALMHHLITNAEHLLKACEFSHPDEVPSEYW